jgi:nucleotide-binding universal stress UspA family protein
VVAGVASISARSVVAWAAAEATDRHAELRLVTARPAAAAPDQYLPNEVADEHRADAVRLLADMAADVTAGWPGLTVTTELTAGPPATVLRNAAHDAQLLVVGADDASPFVEAISGSVPGELLTTTPCPLVVVPRREWMTPASAPVVVAFDEPTTSTAALAYAFAAASRSGRSLTVLHCGSVPADGAQALMGFGGLYPAVEVTTDVTDMEPKTALMRASRKASVLVLGSRGRGRLASGLFGSVSRDLIRRSACPVVVARAQDVVADQIARTS